MTIDLNLKTKFNIISKKILHSGYFKLHEYIVEHKKHDNSWSNQMKREVFGGAHVSAVLPYDPISKKIVLIEQFRTGLIKNNYDPIIKEIVAGNIDEGESPEEAAIRECNEEIDCEIKKLKKITSYFPAPASSESFYHIFLGEIESFAGERIKGQENENEDILSKCYSYEEVKKLLENNQIINGLTIIALQWFFLNL